MSDTFYGVEYRNMGTGVHGLFVYDNENNAYQVDDLLNEKRGEDTCICIDYDDELSSALARTVDEHDWAEIDYRDVEFDEQLSEWVYRGDPDDNTLIIVVNEEHDVYDIYNI